MEECLPNEYFISHYLIFVTVLVHKHTYDFPSGGGRGVMVPSWYFLLS